MKRFGYGLIGAGSFGQFCLKQYRQMDELRAVAVADIDADAARKVAEAQGIEASPSVDDLLGRDDIDIVHIVTPPFTHRDLAHQAIERGKHVLCEKPLAVTLEDARAMTQAAREAGRVLAVNLIMRYNPLCAAVKQLVDERLFGEPLHGFFENDAVDETLKPGHWFWERQKSGGIFIEHAVHFFDLFRWWLGEDEVVAAHQVERPGHAGVFEQVQATVRYRPGPGPGTTDVFVKHHHSFTQPSRLERQEMRILFERGEIRLHEWVPTRAEITFLGTKGQRDRLMEILPDADVKQEKPLTGDDRHITGRFKPFEADGHYTLTASPGMGKQDLYGHIVRALMADQLAAARNSAHQRIVSEENGVSSLATAVKAQELADG